MLNIDFIEKTIERLRYQRSIWWKRTSDDDPTKEPLPIVRRARLDKPDEHFDLLKMDRRTMWALGGVGGMAALLAHTDPANADQAFTSFGYKATGASTDRTTPDRLIDYINFKDWGAVGDTSTNDQPAIQNAINWQTTSSARGLFYFPPAQIIGGVQKLYHVTTPIDLTWVKGASGGLPSVVITGSGTASKIQGSVAGYILSKNSNTYTGYDEVGILTIEKLVISNTNTTANTGGILISTNVGCKIDSCGVGGQNGIVLQNGCTKDVTGVTTAGAAAGTSILTFASTPGGVVDNSSYAFDATNPTAIVVAPRATPSATRVTAHDATTVTLNTPIAAPGVSSGDTIQFGNSALFVFTSTIINCVCTGFGKGGPSNGVGIAASQGCQIIGCDITAWNIGVIASASAVNIYGGRFEVNDTAIRTGIDQQGYSLAGTTNFSLIGPSFESNNIGIDCSTGGGPVNGLIAGCGFASTDGGGIDGVRFKSDSGSRITMIACTVNGGYSGYAIRNPASGAGAQAQRTFISVNATNTSSASRYWEMGPYQYHSSYIQCNNPDPITVYANLPNSSSTRNSGDTYWISDGKTTNCADGACTTFGTVVTGGGGALKLGVTWNGTAWTLSGI